MKPIDIFVNFGISALAGPVTGALFARRSGPDPESERVIRHIVMTSQQDHGRTSGVPQDSSSSTITYVPATVLAMLFAVSLLSKYKAQILHFGWLLLLFFGPAVLSFTALTLARNKNPDRFTFWSLRSLLCTAASAYIFHLFSRSLAEPAYAAYLESIRS